MQYLPWLKSAGLDVCVSPLLPDSYIHNLQRGGRNLADAGAAYARRLEALSASREFDLVWIEKELFPWLPYSVEAVLLSSKAPYVLDYDDAVFHQYDLHRRPAVRCVLGTKHRKLMAGAALVVVGNEYLADYAWRAGAARVEIVPTVIDLERYTVRDRRNVGEQVSIGWIGQRATASFLKPYAGIFKLLSSEANARFVAIGIDATSFDLPMDSVPWTEDSEVASIAACDIGVMPLVDGPFERGKCGYKLIQYMACGLPVVASPVGVNRDIVEHGVNGFLAETPQDWEWALRRLLANEGLRRRMGAAGRRKVEQEYALQVTGPRLSTLLRAVQ